MTKRLLGFTKLLLYFLMGILIAGLVEISQSLLFILCFLSLSFSTFFYFFSNKISRVVTVSGFQIGVFILTASLAIILLNNRKPEKNLMLDSSSQRVLANATIELIITKPKVSEYTVRLKEGYIGSRYVKEPIKFVLKLDSSNVVYYPGDNIWIEGVASSFYKNTNPGSFNYHDFMINKGLLFEVKPTKLSILNRPKWSIKRTLFLVRAYFTKRLKKILRPREFGVAEALVLGQRQYLDPKTKNAYRGVGAIHVLAVSGLHIGLVFLIFNWLLKSLGRFKYGVIVKQSLIILAIVFYAALTDFSPSVTRASLMFILFSIGGMLRRPVNVYHTIFTSAFLILLYNPNLIYNLGFQLSYLAVIGIIYLYPKLVLLFTPKYFVLKKIWELMCVSIAAQIATFPIVVYYFHQFPTYFFITNLIVVPGAAIALSGAFLMFSLFLFPFFSMTNLVSFFGNIYQCLLWSLNESIEYIYRLPYSSIKYINLSAFEFMFLVLIVFFTILFFVYKNRVVLRILMLSVLLGCILTTIEKYQIYSTSGVLVYQYSTLIFEVFEGKKAKCYTLPLNNKKKKNVKKMRVNFFNSEGRENQGLIESKLFQNKKKSKIKVYNSPTIKVEFREGILNIGSTQQKLPQISNSSVVFLLIE